MSFKNLEKGYYAFIVAIAIAYVAFLICDIFTEGMEAISSALKYFGILMCFLISVKIYLKNGSTRAAKLQMIVLAFTVVADFFLLFTSLYVLGMLIFFGAHLTAIYRYYRPLLKTGIAIILLGATIWIVSIILSKPLDLLLCASIVYLTLILLVTVTTFLAKQKPINNILSRLGMILFILCDINVALFNTVSHQSVIYAVSSMLMWAFYIPAQTMLSLSAYDY